MAQVKVYTTSYCPWCTKAKSLLTSVGADFEEIDVEKNMKLREELAEKYSWRTVPMIVVGDTFVGGYDDLKKIHDSGELTKKLNE